MPWHITVNNTYETDFKVSYNIILEAYNHHFNRKLSVPILITTYGLELKLLNKASLASFTFLASDSSGLLLAPNEKVVVTEPADTLVETEELRLLAGLLSPTELSEGGL